MSDDITQRMVEAGARAIHDTDDMADTVWPDSQDDSGYRGGSGYVKVCRDTELYRRAARACIAAAHAAVEVEGVALCKVPDAKGPDYQMMTDDWSHYPAGWNACRAAVLAGKVTL
jgi:hypothetical protein